MTESTVLVENHGAVRVLFLHRPKKRNAINVRMTTELSRAIDAADADDNVRVILVTGSGAAFSAGVDVSLFLGQADDVSDLQGPILQPIHITRAIVACKKPILAAINGLAVGMATTILPYFDAIYASDQASFCTPFVKLGLVVEFGASYTLPRLIGPHRTNELILTGTPIDATTALSWGLCTRVFPAATFLASVIELATNIAKNPPHTVQQNKALLRRGALAPDVATAMSLENEVLSLCYGSEENTAAVSAFLKGRR